MSTRSELHTLSHILKEAHADLRALHIELQEAWGNLKQAQPGSKEWFEANSSFVDLQDQWNKSWTEIKRLQGEFLTVASQWVASQRSCIAVSGHPPFASV